MKLPFQKLVVLMLFVGAPFGLMKLTSQAIQTPETYPLMSTAPESGLALSKVMRQAMKQAITPKKLFYSALRDSMRNSPAAAKLVSLHDYLVNHHDYLDSHRNERFTHISAAKHTIPGLIASTRRAMASSWKQWQPILLALPDRLCDLPLPALLTEWRNRANAYVATARTPIATRSPLPSTRRDAVYERLATPIPTVLYSTVKSILFDAARWMTFPSMRMASQAMGELPTPSLGVARMADEVRGWTAGLRVIGNLVQTSIDNR